jgi:hypothetical protein
MICPKCKKTARSSIDYARVMRYGECTDCAIKIIPLEDVLRKAERNTKKLMGNPMITLYKFVNEF